MIHRLVSVLFQGGGVPSPSCAATNSVHDSDDVVPMSDEEAEEEEEREETVRSCNDGAKSFISLVLANTSTA